MYWWMLNKPANVEIIVEYSQYCFTILVGFIVANKVIWSMNKLVIFLEHHKNKVNSLTARSSDANALGNRL